MVDAMELGDIDLSDMEGFWTKPMVDREAAFATLRREDPIRFFEETKVISLQLSMIIL